MKRIAKRRLSCLLSAILLLVMSLDMSAFAGVFEKTARKIDVWDFGGVAESNTEMYQNNISASDWDNCSDVGTNAKFNAASIKFGDLETPIPQKTTKRIKYKVVNITAANLRYKLDKFY